MCAPTTVLGSVDGQLRPVGAQGAFHADVRVLSRAELRVDGREPEPLTAMLDGASSARFVGLDRHHGDAGADPTVRVERHRRATPTGLVERVVIWSASSVSVVAEVQLAVEVDLAGVDTVKTGAPTPVPLAGELAAGAGVWRGAEGIVVRLEAPGARLSAGPQGMLATWPVEVPPRGRRELEWSVTVQDPGAVVAAPAAAAPWRRPQVTADDPRLMALLNQSLDDLDGLRLVLADRPDDQFVAAGSPWFLTLFGRDSLWAARMLLPLGTGIAAGTLAVLASRQGVKHDPVTEEQPGKILHELRRADFTLDAAQGTSLPPVYYGTVDATALWVLLLHDAWRWGMPEAAVTPLLPHLEAAMTWLVEHGDPDGDGFFEYVDSHGTGLANQGWKDSWDSVRFRDGSIAHGPVALVEVQGYAYEAAHCAAALLTAFGRPGADRWSDWAQSLKTAFSKAFWLDGGYPALALDGDKRAVDALTSNIGHLLGTGLLEGEQARLVADVLAGPGMDSGYGLRTMATQDGGYSPMSYHCGSVWPHDTAITVTGLAREGFGQQAARLGAGLLRAGSCFDSRLPELFSGDPVDAAPSAIPYPAACRPQAWSAAAAVSLLRDLLGLQVDVPAGVLRLRPVTGSPVGALTVRGLSVGDGTLDVVVDRSGAVVEAVTTSGLRIEVLEATG